MVERLLFVLPPEGRPNTSLAHGLSIAQDSPGSLP